ncbi:Ppx/GppA family phosphatase [Micrococcales bacterium 31B]|nr:Ppx/GppA family phosphatase [Micrococcales bacterium 31B]
MTLVTGRVAAIDCGTNSIRLLVSDMTLDGASLVSATDVDRRMEVVRLGEGVDQTGRISAAAMQRTLDATARYADMCRDLGVSAIRFVATSASRDAENRDEFVTGVRDLIGVEPEVIAGSEEAALSFGGAVRSLGADVPGPHLVVDIGGGSTEFVLGDTSVEQSLSVDIGCVRLTERHLAGDPATATQIAAALVDIDAAIDRAAAVVDLGRARSLVGLAGSITTVTAYVLGLEKYDSAAIHGASFDPDVVRAACADLTAMPRAQRAALGFMHPGRVDVIGAGALVWSRIIERVTAEAGAIPVVTSERDILDGIAWSAALAGLSGR